MKLHFDEYLSLPFYHPGMSGLIPTLPMLFSVANIAMFFYLCFLFQAAVNNFKEEEIAMDDEDSNMSD